jgi:hypothetical protein
MQEIMFSEAQLRKAVLDMIRIHEESYVDKPTERFTVLDGGRYTKSTLDSAIEACADNGLPSTLAPFLDLASHWFNDVADWARGEYDSPENFVNPEEGLKEIL